MERLGGTLPPIFVRLTRNLIADKYLENEILDSRRYYRDWTFRLITRDSTPYQL